MDRCEADKSEKKRKEHARREREKNGEAAAAAAVARDNSSSNVQRSVSACKSSSGVEPSGVEWSGV